jgi:hypothetical protein
MKINLAALHVVRKIKEFFSLLHEGPLKFSSSFTRAASHLRRVLSTRSLLKPYYSFSDLAVSVSVAARSEA